MNLRFLETFVWLAKLRNFRVTAEKLHTTQAAVSSRIATLEQDFGARLFDRGSREVTLTQDGNRGYAGTFTVALDGLPATTGGGRACADLTACRAAVAAALPDPTAAAEPAVWQSAQGVREAARRGERGRR